MLKTRTWALFFAGLVACAALALWWMPQLRGDGTVARILQDGTCVVEINLARVEEPYEFVLENGDGGSNTIRVEPGRIRVSAADCPDQVCVGQGWLTSEGAGSIVCLPHGLVIQLEGMSDVDAVSQ